MLIYIRRVRESLKIGDSITVTVLGVKGDKVCIGVSAPPGVPVVCKETCQRQLSERESLAPGSTPRRA